MLDPTHVLAPFRELLGTCQSNDHLGAALHHLLDEDAVDPGARGVVPGGADHLVEGAPGLRGAGDAEPERARFRLVQDVRRLDLEGDGGDRSPPGAPPPRPASAPGALGRRPRHSRRGGRTTPPRSVSTRRPSTRTRSIVEASALPATHAPALHDAGGSPRRSRGRGPRRGRASRSAARRCRPPAAQPRRRRTGS